MSSSVNNLIILVVICMVLQTDAFQAAPCNRKVTTTLQAWSLPTDVSLKSTWYNEYNPTARAMVYHDPTPIERYSFVALGNDWPSAEEPTEDPVVQRRPFKPIKRALRRRALMRQIRRIRS